MTLTEKPRLDGGRPLGHLLVDAGLITHQQLADALSAQTASGGRLGMHLIAIGAVTRMDLYQTIADQLGFPFVNLIDEPPDANLMRRMDPETDVTRDWIPYRWDADTLVLATTEPPTRQTINDARRQFGVECVDFVISTDWDLDQALMR